MAMQVTLTQETGAVHQLDAALCDSVGVLKRRVGELLPGIHYAGGL